MNRERSTSRWLWLLPPYWVYRTVIRGPIRSSFGPVIQQWNDARNHLHREAVSDAGVPSRDPRAAMAAALREHAVPGRALSAIYIRLAVTTYVACFSATLALAAAIYFTAGPGSAVPGAMFVASIALLCSFTATLGVVRHGFNARQLLYMSLFDFRYYVKAIDQWLPPFPTQSVLRLIRERYTAVLKTYPREVGP